MKRARTAKAVADTLQLHELAYDRHDVRLLTDLRDDVVGNHQSSAIVTPAPPSFQAPSRNCFTRVSLLSISATRSRNAPVPFPWMMLSEGKSARIASSSAWRTVESSSSA